MSKFFSDPPFSKLTGNKPDKGLIAALTETITNGIELIKAEIALTLAEFAAIAKDKAKGIVVVLVALVFAWLAFQTFFILVGAIIAIWLPVWAAVLIVLLIFIIVTVVLLYVAYRYFAKDSAMHNSQRERAATQSAIAKQVATSKASALAKAKQAVATTKETTKAAVEDIKQGAARNR